MEDTAFTVKELPGISDSRNIVVELQARQSGNISLLNLKQSILINRINEMSYSHSVDFERVHKSSLNSMDVEKSGRYLLSGGKDGSVYIHDLFNLTGQKVYLCKLVEGASPPVPSHPPELNNPRRPMSVETPRRPMSVETVQWYPFDSGMFLTSGMDRTVRVWDTNVMKDVQTFNFSAKIFQHHISPVPTRSSPLIAVASGLSEVKMVDLRTGQYSQELRGHSNCVFCCRWSPTAPYVLATGSYDSTIRLWDARSSKACFAILDKENRHKEGNRQTNLFKSHMGSVNGLEFTPNGRFLVSLGSDSTACCWDLHNLKNLDIPFGKIHNRKGRAIEFATCGFKNHHFCFIPDQCSIAIFELETGKKIKTLAGHYLQVNTCYFHKEKMELYSGGQDRNILMWTVEHQNEDEDTIVNVKTENGLDWSSEEDD